MLNIGLKLIRYSGSRMFKLRTGSFLVLCPRFSAVFRCASLAHGQVLLWPKPNQKYRKYSKIATEVQGIERYPEAFKSLTPIFYQLKMLPVASSQNSRFRESTWINPNRGQNRSTHQLTVRISDHLANHPFLESSCQFCLAKNAWYIK